MLRWWMKTTTPVTIFDDHHHMEPKFSDEEGDQITARVIGVV